MLSAAQFSRGMNNAERVLANGDILQAKSAIFVRELKPGMVKDINPRAHRAVKYATLARLIPSGASPIGVNTGDCLIPGRRPWQIQHHAMLKDLPVKAGFA